MKAVIVFIIALLSLSIAFSSQVTWGAIQEYEPPLPPGWKDRSITLLYQVEHVSSHESSTGNHTLLHISLNDGNDNQTIKAVTYSIRISSDQSGVVPLFADTFYSSSGPLTLDITYDEMLSSTTVAADRDEYLDVWAANENGLVKIRTPVLKQDYQYFLHVEILGAESPSNFFSEEVMPEFDFYLSPEDMMEKVTVPEFPMLAMLSLAIPFFVMIAFMRSGRLRNNR